MLTDIAARKAKPRDKPYKLSDSAGLFLLVTVRGARSWRMKYRFGGKEGLLTFGLYPEVTLTEARDRRAAARRLIRDGIDPAPSKAPQAEATDTPTFETVARDWHALHAPKWKEHHAKNILNELERDVFPFIGKAAIADLDPPAILEALRKVEARPALEAARRARQRMSAVFVFGIGSSLCANDPAAIVVGALAPKRPNKKRPAMLKLVEIKKLLRDVEKMRAYPGTQLAIRLLALTAVRPGEVAGAAWTEFTGLDTDEPLWTIPADRMKAVEGQRADHLVPLSIQAVEILKAVATLTGKGPLPFPNTRWAHKPMGENTMGHLIDRAGYKGKHVPHGFRSTFSTRMNDVAEREGRDRDRAIIDLMLAHIPKDEVEGIYNRNAYMRRRRELAQQWADMLLAGFAPAASLLMTSRRSGG
nr:integrase arm-type DNA-binding domain-containing protein [Polymorphobacter sp.]